jgi:hypothetical protein
MISKIPDFRVLIKFDDDRKCSLVTGASVSVIRPKKQRGKDKSSREARL